MNLKSTILILGAGASKPYGYPTAGELRNDIIKEYPGVIRETSNLLGHSWDKTEESIRNIKPIIENLIYHILIQLICFYLEMEIR